MDGNHSLNKKTKREDRDDASLGQGKGFFVDHNQIAETLKEIYANDDDIVVSDCHARATRLVTTYLTVLIDSYLQRLQGRACATRREVPLGRRQWNRRCYLSPRVLLVGRCHQPYLG